MSKWISLAILILSAVVIFNLCFFLCVSYDGNTRAWVCYLFFHLAYILSMLGYLFTTRRRFAVLNGRLTAISLMYLTITTITCIFFFLYSDYSKEWEIFVFLIELFLYLMSFHYCHLTNKKAEKGIIKDLKNASMHDRWLTELKLLINGSDDEKKTKMLSSLINEIRSCPSLSNPYVYDVDNEINTLIRSLKVNYRNIQVAELSDYNSQISTAIRKRKEILKISFPKV